MKLRVVLVEPEGKINFGFIVRLCKNFEVDELAVVRPKFEVDDEEILRFAAQGKDYISKVRVYETLDEALNGVKLCTSGKASSKNSFRSFILPWEIKKMYGYPEELSLVFGRESVGLTRDELSKCDGLVHIPASSFYPILNLSHAVAIVLYEVWKQYRLDRGTLPERPGERDFEILNRVLRGLADKFMNDEKKRENVLLGIKKLTAKANKAEFRSLLYLLSKCSNFIEKNKTHKRC